MGRLELPIPELGPGDMSLSAAAKSIQAKIRKQIPPKLRDSVVVTAFKKEGRTGLAIEYDDRAENFVYMAMEYPRGGQKEESAVPRD